MLQIFVEIFYPISGRENRNIKYDNMKCFQKIHSENSSVSLMKKKEERKE